MLYEIVCEKFKITKITFNSGLNIVLGTKRGDNSIGKSTFLLVVDFVFGGSSYANSSEIEKHIGDHTICFCFKFNDEKFYFSRDFIESNKVWKCDENYNKKECITKNAYCQWLNKYYNINIPHITFRNIVSRYIRVHGKDNINEKQPLNNFPKEKNKEAINALIKLFGIYERIEDISQQVDEYEKQIKSYKEFQKFNFITKISKSTYKENKKQIQNIKEEINEICKKLEGQTLDIGFEISQQAIKIKKELFNFRRMSTNLKKRLNNIEENLGINFKYTTEDFKILASYFENINIKKIEKIEKFHKNISDILKNQLNEERKNIILQLQELKTLIEEYEIELNDLIKNPNISKMFLKQYSELDNKLKNLKEQNESYEKLNSLIEVKEKYKEDFYKIKKEILQAIEKEINCRMKNINKVIYGKENDSPILHLNYERYTFFTPDDSGTGTSYKGLIVFDLAILDLTKLPILIHDSVLLKQISDEAIEKILYLYQNSHKQVIISLDKQDSYTQEANYILEANCVLRLGNNGDELFGINFKQG